MRPIRHLQSLTLDLPPSCIEFWPVNERYAVVGTYNLDTANHGSQPISQRRNGSVILLYADGEQVKIIQTLSTPSAILDIHFGPSTIPASHFGAATSTGSFNIYQLKEDQFSNVTIEHIKTIQFFSEDVLITAFSWHPKGWSVGMTLSSGQVCLGQIDLSDGHTPTSDVVLASHDLEAWTLAFTSDGFGAYSGGDDSALKYICVAENQAYHQAFTVEPQYSISARMSWTDKKIHGAGVTAILPLTVSPEKDLVLTGSYDDHIRLLETHAVGRRTVVAELNLGGGVWRLKRLDDGSSSGILLLASCMHAGARILRLRQDTDQAWGFEVVAKFEEHKSMNYGSDCQPSLDAEGQRVFISTSFYDRLLCLWRC